MRVRWICAANVGVQAFDSVHEAVRLEKFQRTVNGRRGGARLLSSKLFEQVVGKHGPVGAPHQFEDALTCARQSCLIVHAHILCSSQGIAYAAPMVMSAGFETGNRLAAHAFSIMVESNLLYHNILDITE